MEDDHAMATDGTDLTGLLASWPYEPGRLTVRRIHGSDDREKLQIRLALGLLQLELDGRPDGARPHGAESLLLHHRARLQADPTNFSLDEAECRALREEVLLYSHRYVALVSLGEHERVIRDTTRNLEAIALCQRFAGSPQDRVAMQQARPQATMMRARAEAELSIAAGVASDALAVLDRGLNELQTCYEEMGCPERFERANETQLLRGMRDVLIPKLPASQRYELEERLRAALDAENYELAAILRDELRMMR